MKALGIDKRQITLPTIISLAAMTRLIGISSRPIWYDEAFAILFSAKGPAAMAYGTLAPAGAGAADIHPLGYYILLWLWMQVFGQSLTAVRILSILAGIATVVLSYFLIRDLFEKNIALIAALFVVLAPFPVHYSQEIRMYSFLALWLILATFAFQRGSTRGGAGWWVLFSVSAALGQYTHNLAAFYLLPLAITPLLRKDRKALLAVVLAGLGAVLLYLPWLLQLPNQIAKVSAAYWVERPGAEKIFTLLLVYVTNLPLPENLLFAGLFIALAVTAIAFLQTFRRANRNPNALWLLYLSFTPPILLFFVSQWVSVYIERALLPSGIIFCLWLAWALFGTSLPRILQIGLAVLLALGAAVGLYQHVTYKGFPYAPFQELEASLSEQIVPGDVIIHSSKLSLLPTVYYDPTLPQIFIADPQGSRNDTLAEATREVLGVTAAPDIETAAKERRRVWYVIFKRSIKETQAAGITNYPPLQYLDQHFKLIATQDWGSLLVFLYENQP
jgi:mannosyltransferase